jgi:cysteine desulfurase
MSAAGPRVYLDHNASSPLRPEAAEAMREAERETSGDPAAPYAEGRAARALLERAREQVAGLVGASPEEVVFTSGGSEAVAAAVRGVCDRAPHALRRLVVSSIEHFAVLESARLAARRGFVVVETPCGTEGRVQAESFRMHLDEGVALAALQWANHETGVLQPVEEIGRACREARVPFLVDAAQAAGKLMLDPRQAFADLVALSGHKFGGPQGTGALVVRHGIVLAPLIAGRHEERRRGGTPGVAALAGLGAAARAASGAVKEEGRRLLRLRAKIETRLRELFPDIRFHGQASPRLPNTVSFALPDLAGERVARALDGAGVAVGSSATGPDGEVEPSPVVLAMGFDEEQARAALRVSLGWSTTRQEVDAFLTRFPDIVQRLRRKSDQER